MTKDEYFEKIPKHQNKDVVVDLIGGDITVIIRNSKKFVGKEMIIRLTVEE